MTEPRTSSARILVYAVTALALVAALGLLLHAARTPPAGDAGPEPGAPAEAAGPTEGPPAATAPESPAGPAAPTAEAPELGPDGYAPGEPRPQRLEVRGAGPHTLSAGGTFVLDAGSLAPDRPVAFVLALPDEAKLEHADHAIRVVAEDGRLLHRTAPAGETGVQLELEPDWLSPGRYVVEVKTAEKTHLPLRRWAIEVP